MQNATSELWAVEELDRTQCPEWCVVGLYRSKESAREHGQCIVSNHSLGIHRRARIKRAPQYVVDFWNMTGQHIGN